MLVNGSIMTLYLWHATAMTCVVALAYALGGFGLGLRPDSGAWWATRPLWIACCGAVLAVCLALFARFEQAAHRESRAALGSPLPAWRSVAGATGVCAGLAVLALNGIGAPHALGVHVPVVLLTLVAALVATGLPRRAAAP